MPCSFYRAALSFLAMTLSIIFLQSIRIFGFIKLFFRRYITHYMPVAGISAGKEAKRKARRSLSDLFMKCAGYLNKPGQLPLACSDRLYGT